MERYLIHTHYKATDSNPNFAGQTQDWLRGKGGKVFVDHPSNRTMMARFYGYTRMQDAKRVLHIEEENARSEEAYGHWYRSEEVIVVEV